MIEDIPVYMTAREASAHMGLSRPAAGNAYRAGHLKPAAYAGERPLFNEDVCAAYLKQRTDWLKQHPKAAVIWERNANPEWGRRLLRIRHQKRTLLPVRDEMEG